MSRPTPVPRLRVGMHRCFLSVVITLGGVWIWASVMLHRARADAVAFQTERVFPALQARKEDRPSPPSSGHEKQVPLAPYRPAAAPPIDEWLERMKPIYRYEDIRFESMTALMAVGFLWMLATIIQLEVRRRRWESPDRPAVLEAGQFIGEMVQLGQILTAKAGNGPKDCRIEVDGQRAVVAFRNYTFITAFLGNPKRDLVEVPFIDLIAASLTYDKGHAFLHVRTTKGKVMITDKVRPFQTLAEVLIDAVEINRTSPDQYRATVAREPVVRTPWYGWLMIAATLAAVAAVWWWMLQH